MRFWFSENNGRNGFSFQKSTVLRHNINSTFTLVSFDKLAFMRRNSIIRSRRRFAYSPSLSSNDLYPYAQFSTISKLSANADTLPP